MDAWLRDFVHGLPLWVKILWTIFVFVGAPIGFYFAFKGLRRGVRMIRIGVAMFRRDYKEGVRRAIRQRP